MPADPKLAHVALELTAEARGLMACRFDPVGKHLFASAENRSIYRWKLEAAAKDPKHKPVAFGAHESWMFDLAVTADGQTLISAGGDDQLIWWPASAEAPQPIRKVKAHQGWIRSIRLSPDGKLLASGGNDRMLRVWNVADGTKVHEFSEAAREIWSVAFHPDGKSVLGGDLDGKIHQWDIAAGKHVRSFDAAPLHEFEKGQSVHYGGVRALVVSTDGKWVVGGGLHKGTNPLGNIQQPLALRFDWQSAKLTRQHVTTGFTNERIWGMHYHAQGFLVAAIGGSKGALLFWNEGDDPSFHTFALPSTARGMAVSSDGMQIATTHFDSKVRVTKLSAKTA